MEAAGRGAQPPRPPPAVAVVTPPPPVPLISSAPPVPAAPAPSPAGKAPVLVVDLAGATDAAGSATAKPAAAAGSAAGGARLNADEQFAARVETGPEPEHASATLLRNQSTLAPQGTIIPAVLETALNSDLPGFARAVVSRDVRSFDGSNVLIPRGSRVIGEYRSASSLGASRIFVIWTRVLRPDGGSIQIGSGGGRHAGTGGAGRQGRPPLLRAVQRGGAADRAERRRLRRRGHPQHPGHHRLHRRERRGHQRPACRPTSRRPSRWPRARPSASSSSATWTSRLWTADKASLVRVHL